MKKLMMLLCAFAAGVAMAVQSGFMILQSGDASVPTE